MCVSGQKERGREIEKESGGAAEMGNMSASSRGPPAVSAPLVQFPPLGESVATLKQAAPFSLHICFPCYWQDITCKTTMLANRHTEEGL